MPFIRDCVTRFRLDGEDLEPEQFLVVRDRDGIIAFGRIKPYGAGVYELSSVGVIYGRRNRGLGEAMVRELIRRFPSDMVYVTTDLTSYFERLGFRIDENPPAVIRDKVQRVCGRVRTGVVPMTFRRNGAAVESV
jgi:N-acetylglutamate synthase-like GNAT family acetyltransferase